MKRNIQLFYIGVIILLIGLLACKEEITLPNDPLLLLSVKDTWKTYTIDSASHFCEKNDFEPFNTDSLCFKVVFDESAIYTSQNSYNQSDINKLYGFSDCSTFHQKNSARFGWNWQNNALRIYAYVYSDGTRISKEITSVVLGRENSFKIEKKEGQYIFTVNNQHRAIVQAGCDTRVEGYRLYPYFGGDESAPHRITIRILDLDF